jgi:hypothetical protein
VLTIASVSYIMDSKVNREGRNILAIGAGVCHRKLSQFDDLRQGDNRSAVQPVRHHGVRDIVKKRGQSKKFLEKTGNNVLTIGHLLKADMSIWLGAGHLDPFMKFPVCVGSTERELLHLGMYRIPGICDTCNLSKSI